MGCLANAPFSVADMLAKVGSVAKGAARVLNDAFENVPLYLLPCVAKFIIGSRRCLINVSVHRRMSSLSCCTAAHEYRRPTDKGRVRGPEAVNHTTHRQGREIDIKSRGRPMLRMAGPKTVGTFQKFKFERSPQRCSLGSEQPRRAFLREPFLRRTAYRAGSELLPVL